MLDVIVEAAEQKVGGSRRAEIARRLDLLVKQREILARRDHPGADMVDQKYGAQVDR